MDITEPGTSIQIRILYEDAERLYKLKTGPEEAWYKVIGRLLDENEQLKKQLKQVNKPLI